MKKIFRTIAVLLAALLMCLSFTSCTALQKARASHGIWTDSGSIMLGGTEYIMLPECEYLQPIMNSYYPAIYVTEAEVPVLLKTFLGIPFYKSDDGAFLSSDYYSDDYSMSYYCRTDRYDEIISRMEEGLSSGSYCYGYYDYENDLEKYYRLSEIETQAVNAVLAKEKATTLPDVASLEYDYAVKLELCSPDMLFRKASCEICVINGIYYITKLSETENLLYRVNESMNDTFESIMSAYIDSEKYWEEW